MSANINIAKPNILDVTMPALLQHSKSKKVSMLFDDEDTFSPKYICWPVGEANAYRVDNLDDFELPPHGTEITIK